MAIAISASPASARVTNAELITLSVTGGAASTNYIMEAGVTQITRTEFTTDGSGAATILYHAHGNPGVKTFSIRPATEYKGTTTAAATCTANITS